MSTQNVSFQAGQRVIVTQQIPQRDKVWTIRTEGVVIKDLRKKTGSWFAHAKDDKLWLDRLVVRKDDGEIVMFILDDYTHIEIVPKSESEESEAAASESNAEPEPDTQDPAAD